MNTTSTCALLAAESTKSFITNFSTIVTFWFKPSFLALDFFGHLLCFIGFYKESGRNRSFSFQFYEIGAKCLDTFGAFFNLFFNQWFSGRRSALELVQNGTNRAMF